MIRSNVAMLSRGPWSLALLVLLTSQAGAAEAPALRQGGSSNEQRPLPPGSPHSSGIMGRVLFEGKATAGVWLRVYTDASTDFRGSGFARFGPTADDGRFRLDLKPGRYFLVGTKGASGAAAADAGIGDLFGYYGGNPVKVIAGSAVEINLQLVKRKAMRVHQGDGPSITIAGVIEGPRGPEESAALFAYPDAASDFRGPDISGPLGSIVGGTASDGRFSLELPPGTYYLVAAKRKSGTALGPLQVGDLFGYFDGNPLRLQAGQKAEIAIHMTEKLRQQEPPAATPGATGIRGRIVDPSGRPVAGVFAFATTDPNLIGAMPPHHSRPVGPDGVFFIELPDGGTFYVGARTGFGGPPQPGQWQGMLGDANIRTVTVKKGKLVDGVDITVRVVE